jgi:hypothetical protein
MSDTEKIFNAHIEAMARGTLNIWTVYDHPADYPHSYVARRFEYDKLTDDIVQGELSIIRESFRRCGLTCLPRDPSDDATIVETWL